SPNISARSEPQDRAASSRPLSSPVLCRSRDGRESRPGADPHGARPAGSAPGRDRQTVALCEIAAPSQTQALAEDMMGGVEKCAPEVWFARDSPLEEGGFEPPRSPLRSKLSRLPGTLFADSYSSNRLTICSRERCASRSARRHVFARATLRRTQVKPGHPPCFHFHRREPSPR